MYVLSDPRLITQCSREEKRVVLDNSQGVAEVEESRALVYKRRILAQRKGFVVYAHRLFTKTYADTNVIDAGMLLVVLHAFSERLKPKVERDESVENK